MTPPSAVAACGSRARATSMFHVAWTTAAASDNATAEAGNALLCGCKVGRGRGARYEHGSFTRPLVVAGPRDRRVRDAAQLRRWPGDDAEHLRPIRAPRAALELRRHRRAYGRREPPLGHPRYGAGAEQRDARLARPEPLRRPPALPARAPRDPPRGAGGKRCAAGAAR